VKVETQESTYRISFKFYKISSIFDNNFKWGLSSQYCHYWRQSIIFKHKSVNSIGIIYIVARQFFFSLDLALELERLPTAAWKG
jgi:hypothetical protein